ncbi:MAG: hypothetical protein M9962_03240 [Oligoflexia bacterium]|nr:hypothetical protein [Oligoflexia bacterium]
MNRSFLFSIGIITLTLPILAVANSGGKTANGCTYSIINGKYLYTCAGEKISNTQSDQIVTSYSSVPVRENPEAAAPSRVVVEQKTVSSIDPNQGPQFDETMNRSQMEAYVNRVTKSSRATDKLIDATFFGIRANTFSNNKIASSGVGFGLTAGTNLDEFFAVELAYAFSKQDINLGLSNRGFDPNQNSTTTVKSGNDTSLTNHLISTEIQAHLTDVTKKLRPYLGAGFGWRISKLKEKANSSSNNNNSFGGVMMNQSQNLGVLKQSSFGALASAGAKFRASKVMTLQVGFQYFIPVVRQSALLETETTNSNGQGLNNGFSLAPPSRLAEGDSNVTSASQYQIFGGLLFSF